MKVYFCDNSFNLSSLVTTTQEELKSISSTEKITYILEESGEVSAFSKTSKFFSLNLPFKVSTLSCGREHVGILTEDLSVYTWGNGESGALGLSSVESCSVPSKVPLSSDFHINGLVCGGWHTLMLARYSAGKNFLLVTGRNSEGQLGTGKLNRELFPVKVEIPEEILEIRAGNNFSMVLSESKSVYMTGDNRFGQLGIGHKRNVFSFERVPIDNVQDIACGNHSAAVSNGKVYVWGTCSFGEYLRPTLMAGILNPEQVFIGDSVGAALDIEHNVWTWGGKNSEGKVRKTDLKADFLSLNSGSHVFAVSIGKDFVRKKERSNTNSFQFNKNDLLSPAVQKKRSFFNEVTSETPKYNPAYRGFRDGSSEKKNEENRESNKNINFFKEENEKLMNSSQGLTSRLNETLQENHELNEKVAALKRLLEEKDANIKKLANLVENTEEEKQVLKHDSDSLKENIRKLSIDRERLLKSFHSDSEIKAYYEKCLNDLEELRHQEKVKYSSEIESLHQENETIQVLLAQLREENNHLRGVQEDSNRRLESYESELNHAGDIRSQLEEKIMTLQSRLNDLTSANNNLYINLEKEISHKNDLVSLSQLSRHLEENCGSQDQQELQENENLLSLSKSKTSSRPITITRSSHLNEDNPEILTNRKGLSQQHQERLMRVAAEKLQIEDLDNELHSLSSNSPVHAIYSPIRVHKKSFEDVRNTIMNLKKKRSFLHKDPKFASSSFRK